MCYHILFTTLRTWSVNIFMNMLCSPNGFLVINPLRPRRPKSAVQDYTALKYCNFPNHLKMALTVSCGHWVECPSSWDIQYMQKSQRLLQNITFWIWKRTKMIVFKVTEKRQKSRLLPSGFWQKSSLQNQKSTFTVFSACSSLEVTFFCSYSYPGQATAFCGFPR